MTPKLPFLERAGFFAVACLFALTCAAGADTSRDEQIAQRFAAADTNHDGQLTLAEAEAGMPRVAANFNKIDADNSGTVTVAEIEAMADR
jgi:Ca2+-binding EF-hand superfamily protein